LHSFFQRIGISHQVSCPHARQQNGSAERKHRHIVEIGLALLANASMPLKFWDEAFLTATFLINHLPSKVIDLDNPTHKLFGQKPDYNSLCTFGCACWPNLRPYNQRKLSFRSVQCVFLGYSQFHKGFKCLEPKSGRVYISRDVIFDETVFPFAHMHSNAGARLRKKILLLLEHLLNSGRGGVGCTDSHATNIFPRPDLQQGVQDINTEDEDPGAEDPGSPFRADPPAGSGSGSEADPPDASEDVGASPGSPRGGDVPGAHGAPAPASISPGASAPPANPPATGGDTT
jgi:hypothetical protein